MFECLNLQSVTGYFDKENRILRIGYHGIITPDANRVVYTWMGRFFLDLGDGIGNVNGSIYDFRDVSDFVNRYMSTASQYTKHLMNIDGNHHPVAFIVQNLYQEEMVRLTMKINADDKRKQIFNSEAEAQAFIQNFRAIA